MTDIVDRMQGYENWQRREAAGLRAHYSKSPAMPELAEMHEETADALRDARLEIERLRAALVKIAETAPLIGRCSVIARVALLEDSCD